MAVLISDQITGWRADSKIERAAIKILRTQINFKFRRGAGERVCWWKRAASLLAAIPGLPTCRAD